MINKEEAYKRLTDQISVTRQQVVFAKVYMRDHFYRVSVTMIKNLLKTVDITMPEHIVFGNSKDTERTVKEAAEAISWMLAGREAVWELISSNLLIPIGERIDYSIKIPGWATLNGKGTPPTPDEIVFPVPQLVAQPYSIRNQTPQVMSDPDLFLHTLDIEGLHSDVEQALREAVRCFQHELFLARLTMLGRASEGAWIELGLKLTEPVQSKRSQKLKQCLESHKTSITNKIEEVIKYYGYDELCGEIHRKSGIKPLDLQNTVVWSDCVRLSRNSVHYGNNPPMPNNYEKTAALIVGAVQHLRPLYKIMSAVNSLIG